MLLHQITSFSHSVAVKRQVTNRCSRDSSFTPQIVSLAADTKNGCEGDYTTEGAG